MASNWHTNLQPTVTNRVAIVVPRFVDVQLSNGHVVQARSYFVGTAADGNTFVLMLDILFDLFFGNEVNNEITAGNFTSDSVNMTLFPNTFLFSLNANKPDTPGTCCVGRLPHRILRPRHHSFNPLGDSVRQLDVAGPVQRRNRRRDRDFTRNI